MLRVLRRPSHAAIVAYLALFVALGGVGYAATQLPAGSVGTKQLRKHAVTLNKVAVSAQHSLQGQTGPRGPQGLTGKAGPGAIKFHADSTTPAGFGQMTLAHVGAWTLLAFCTKSGSTAKLALRAHGPVDSIMDGSETSSGAFPVSYLGPNMNIGNDISMSTASPSGGTNIDELTVFSPTSGGAHISVFKYANWDGSKLRCKVSGDAYPAS